MVSAESAPSVEKLLVASQWGDEPVPATVVLVDSDPAGDDIKARITGKSRNCKKLIDEDFVLQIGKVVSDSHPVVTTEDIVPANLFKKAVLSYLDRWWGDLEPDAKAKVSSALDDPAFADKGYVEGTNSVLNDYVFDPHHSYDKYGVLQEVIRLVHEGRAEGADLSTLEKNVFKLCEEIRRAVSASQQAARRESGKQAVKRLIDNFRIQNKESSSVFNMLLLLERIQRDLQLLGEDGAVLDGAIKRLLAELRKLRLAGQHQLHGKLWASWTTTLSAMRKNPLQFVVHIEEGVPSPSQTVEHTALETTTLPAVEEQTKVE